MSDTVILSACRTPIGKFGGSLSTVPATDLGAAAVAAAIRQAKIAPELVEEVIMGNVLSAGVGQAPARQAALKAGVPSNASCVTVNMVCGSAMRAIMLADQAIRCGDADVIVAGGMESMSLAPMLLARKPNAVGNQQVIDSMLHDGLSCAFSGKSMGLIAEALAESSSTTRQKQDEYAVESHRRATAAMNDGAFESEIVPVTVPRRSHAERVVNDEGPRSDTDLESLSKLRTVFLESGSITPGNSSMLSDGAAALVVASEEFAARRKLKPLARIVGSAVSGVEPEDLFVAPVEAVNKLCARCETTLDEVDLFEINEAFAVQMIACLQQLGLRHDQVNIHGGAIALGHPIGASGARIVATLVHAMRRQKLGRGIASACLGGGNAVAMMVECDE